MHLVHCWLRLTGHSVVLSALISFQRLTAVKTSSALVTLSQQASLTGFYLSLFYAFFYSSMHYSAKHGIAIACRLSVCNVGGSLDQDHISWKSWKLIAWTNSPTSSLFVVEHGEILGRLEVGWEKVACWSTKAAISLKHTKIDEKLLWRTYRNSPTLFWTVPSPTPYSLPCFKIEGSQPQPKTVVAIISGMGKDSLWTANLADTFTGSIRTKAH